ncbi:MAG: 50S ribosomal protein L13 [Candidatus Omnitrophica bacterium]|nr:50S ribosomal protein L13 [Candidatus Omnitrophota bacterium]
MIKRSETSHAWYIVDADEKILGRLATKVAFLLSGKNRVDFTPHVDNGAGVIVTNCDKIRVTGNKVKEKIYTSYSGYPGGLKRTTFQDMSIRKPKYILRHAVKGMLPKTRLGALMLKRLKLYCGTEQPHLAQKPVKVEI